MSRYTPKESTLKTKTMNPVWRGVGCVMLVALTVGGYWLAGYLLSLNLVPLPANLDIRVGKLLTIPGRILLQVAATLLVDVLGYAALVILYAAVNPLKKNPLDAPPPRPQGRTNLPR